MVRTETWRRSALRGGLEARLVRAWTSTKGASLVKKAKQDLAVQAGGHDRTHDSTSSDIRRRAIAWDEDSMSPEIRRLAIGWGGTPEFAVQSQAEERVLQAAPAHR